MLQESLFSTYCCRHPSRSMSLLVLGQLLKFRNFESRFLKRNIQGGPSGHGIQFVDIKLKVLPQYELLILKRNSYVNVNVNKRLSSTRWTTLYTIHLLHKKYQNELNCKPLVILIDHYQSLSSSSHGASSVLSCSNFSNFNAYALIVLCDDICSGLAADWRQLYKNRSSRKTDSQ